MEMWELFLKGLAKTFEEFALKMIEKGKLEKSGSGDNLHSRGGYSRQGQPAEPPRTPKVPTHIQDVEKLQNIIKEIVGRHPEGITMKSIASELNVQWHFLRVPMRQLQTEGVIIKKDLNYVLPKNESQVSRASVTESLQENDSGNNLDSAEAKTAGDIQSRETVQTPLQSELHLDPEHSSDTKETENSVRKTAVPRRRIVDASQLEDKPKTDPALSKLEIRERESLRYRIMTALRGRPEGLNLEKIAEVLDEDIAIISPILHELQGELKILLQGNGKFRLP
jgi:predicted transcriptional regulator